jgi:DNA ligase-1
MKAMLAKTYENQHVTGWLMSEKLDGVRAIWTGAELISRNGNKFFAPAWFTDQLPAGVCLDGELHIGRGLFQKTVGSVRKKSPVDAEWQAIRYCVFDAPEHSGIFEKRLAYCAEILTGCQVAEVVEHVECKNQTHLEQYFAALVAAGAEGVMLRRHGSWYDQRRSENLLKMKPFVSEEAEVIGYQDGEGKHLGRLGALMVRWQGVVFGLGTGLSDAIREAPPRIGAQVSFVFQGLTDGGCPRFPVFLSERNYE